MATSNKSRARLIALLKAGGSLQPEPTWKLTPTTSRSNMRARRRRFGPSVTGSQPNFMPNWHWAFSASLRMRKTIWNMWICLYCFNLLPIIKIIILDFQLKLWQYSTFAVGKMFLILCSSDSLSTVITSTSTAAAWRMCEAGLVGLAKIMRDGSTPTLSTLLISFWNITIDLRLNWVLFFIF